MEQQRDRREEIQEAAMLASIVGSNLKEVDASWTERSRKNIALKLDRNSILQNALTPNSQLPPPPPPNIPPISEVGEVKLIPQAHGDAPLPIPMEVTDAVLAGQVPTQGRKVPPPTPPTPPAQPPQPEVQDNQLSFNFVDSINPKQVNTLPQFVKYVDDKFDHLEKEITIIISFLQEIKRNTTKKYRKFTDEIEGTTRSSGAE